MTTAKETNKAPIIVNEEMEISELSGEKFIIILLKKFSELQKIYKQTTRQNQESNANKMRGWIRK